MNRPRALLASLVAVLTLGVLLAVPSSAVTSGVNGRVAFVSDRGGTRQIYVTRSDGTGVVGPLTSLGSNYDPSVSGDGTRIAFISDRDGWAELYSMFIDGNTQTRLTLNLGGIIESHPSWAPNGSAIAFAGLSGTDSEIYTVKPTGGALTNLTNDPVGFDENPSWSPGGIKIAFDATNKLGNTGTDIYTMVNNGTSVIRLTTDGKSSNPSWFPDNKTISYESAKDNGVPGPVVLVTTGKKPVGLAVTSSKVLYTEWNTDKVKQVDSSGHISTFATLPANGASIERYIAVSPGVGSFPKDDVYATVGPNIYQITPDGQTVTLCQNIPSLPNGETGITFDTVGTFQNKMILTDRTGPVWTLDACGGTATRIAVVGDQVEGPLVAPLSFAPYGGWLLMGNEYFGGDGTVYAVDPSTFAVTTIPDPNNIMNSPEAPILIPPTVCNLPGVAGAYFIAMEDSKEILMFDAINFTGLNNDVLAPSELNPDTENITAIARLHSNGSTIEVSSFWDKIDLPNIGPDLEGSAFAPCGSGSPGRPQIQVPGPHEIYKVDINTLVQTRLTTNSTDDINPAPSPDGLFVVFQSDRDNPGSGIHEVYKMSSVDGSGQTNITNNAANDTTPDWQTVSAVVSVSDFVFTPSTAKPKQGGAVLWDFFGPTDHTATDSTGMGLFDSGQKAAGGYYVFKFPWAGSYPYNCTLHPTQMTGTVKVPIAASPKTGNLTTVFTITWATSKPGFGYNADVQILRPGAADWADWKVDQTSVVSATFVADGGTGTYSFKARLQLGTGAASDYSAPVSITVNP